MNLGQALLPRGNRMLRIGAAQAAKSIQFPITGIAAMTERNVRMILRDRRNGWKASKEKPRTLRCGAVETGWSGKQPI
ncbi:MAG: hypothetical protein ABMA14_03740 [Hyphomonadaceae bacterium]